MTVASLTNRTIAAASEPGPYSRHLPALDGLRGLAILAVIASHIAQGQAAGPVSRTLQAVGLFGAHGVDLFFVLSGFLITGILFDSLGGPGYFRNFYARRSLRIFPLYYGVLFILMLLTPVLHLRWQHSQWLFLTYLQNTGIGVPVYAVNLRPGLEVSHLWSLAVEEQFYLIWPLLVFFLASRRRILFAATLLAVAACILRSVLYAHGVSFDFINASTACRADSLLIGAALAVLMRGPLHDRILDSARICFLIAVGLYTAAITLLPGASIAAWPSLLPAIVFSLPYTLISLVSAVLIVLCLRAGSAVARVFSNPALRFYGRISYGLYVLHYLAFPWFRTLFRGWIEPWTPSKAFAALGSGALIFIISTIAAWLSYTLYERHFLKLKRFFAYVR